MPRQEHFTKERKMSELEELKSKRTKKMVELTNEYVDLSPEGATLDGHFCAEHLRMIAHEIDQLKAMERKEEVKGTL